MIPNAGKGLFSKSQFEPGDIIIEYRGRVIRSEHCMDPFFTLEPKMVQVNKDFSILGNNIAQYANDIIHY
jgi:hypothetical protein